MKNDIGNIGGARQLLAIAAIALGSFLSFAMEPLVGRALLAAFGGTAAVWVTCLVAFQILLVAGYFYAHILTGSSEMCRGRAWVHLILLALAAVWCMCMATWGNEIKIVAALPLWPAAKALVGVLIVAALPFVVLSANSSLVQVLADGNYRLYAVSNIGSLLGLIAYPFLIEPLFSLPQQWLGLGSGMLLYGAFLGGLMLKYSIRTCADAVNSTDDVMRIDGNPLWWFVLSAAGVMVLNAVTAHLTSNVAPIPLLWAMLLAVYLLTFIIGFSGFGERLLPVWNVMAIASVVAVLLAFRSQESNSQDIFLHNAIAAVALLFFGCAAIHSHLYARRPGASRLTRYYLWISLGGAVGGIVSGFVVPLVSNWVIEYPIAVASVVLVVVGMRIPIPNWCKEECSQLKPYWGKIRMGILICAVVSIGFVMFTSERGLLAQGRSFYGAWKVVERFHQNTLGKVFHTYEFMHAGTIHGIESADPIYRDEPTSYFGPKAGGLVFGLHPERDQRGLRCGVIGLGIGTLAWYARSQDTFDFFEICPEVIKVAMDGRWFDFMPNRKGDGSVFEGDAREVLERQRINSAPKYDILIVDAYSGDSIPYHLVTKEAFRLYRERVANGGLLVLQMTNWHIDLFPIAKAAANELNMEVAIIAGEGGNLTTASNWAILSERPLSIPADVPRLDMDKVKNVTLPTDASGSLIGFLKW